MSLIKRRKPIILWAIPLLLSSCATLMNPPVQKVHVRTDANVKVVSVTTADSTDSITKKSSTRQDTWLVKRGKSPLLITVQLDTATKTIKLNPVSSPAYWLNIYFNYGIGMLVDKNNPRRYGYPANSYIGVKDSAITARRLEDIKKGTVDFSFSLTLMNHFNLRSIHGRHCGAGVLGVGTGIDYYYRDNTWLSIGFGAATDRGAEYIGKGYHEAAGSLYASLRNNHSIGRFDLGYGLSFLQLQWRNVTYGDTLNMDQSLKNRVLGLSLAANYKLGKNFRLGILYQPGILNIGSKPGWDYQHHLSFGFLWKWKVAGRKQL